VSKMVYRRGRAAFALSLLILLIFSAFVLYDNSTEEADAILPISLQLNFATEQRGRVGNIIEIRTGPGQTGQFQMNGTLEFYRSTRLLRSKIFVDLNARADHQEVVCTVFPRMIDVQPQIKRNSYEIIVSIQISPATRFSTNAGSLVNVTVWGEWRAHYQEDDIGPFAQGDIPDYPIYVNVRPYHFLDVTFDPVMLELTPGSSGWVTCRVKNNGNGFDRIELSIPGELAFAKSGWIFEFESTAVDIEPNSEAFTRVKITAPREISLWYIQEMWDFPVIAVSYYSTYQIKDGDLFAPYEYNTGIFVQVEGLSFVYVPWMWAITMYLAMALVLFNFGINPLTMRKRRIAEPGFIAIYHIVSNPQRRELARTRRAERKKERMEDRQRKIAEKEKLMSLQPKEGKGLPPKKEKALFTRGEPSGKRAPILDLKRTDDDFDIEIPRSKPARLPERERRQAPRLGGSGKRQKVENDMIDILGSLDD